MRVLRVRTEFKKKNYSGKRNEILKPSFIFSFPPQKGYRDTKMSYQSNTWIVRFIKSGNLDTADFN